MLIVVAGKARRPDLASRFYEEYKKGGGRGGGGGGVKHIDNAYLSAVARHWSLNEVRPLGIVCGAAVINPSLIQYCFGAQSSYFTLGSISVCGESLVEGTLHHYLPDALPGSVHLPPHA